MDPISRRYVWRHLEAIRKDRVILLVSHAMDEAELLADSVAVMKKGNLAALGSPLELKAQYGSALQFNILVPADGVEPTMEAIQERFNDCAEWILVEAGAAGTISVNIAKIKTEEETQGVSVEALGAFVDWLEAEESGVTEYGFSNSSLEEVFLKVTEDSEEEKKEE
jgi:ABC-type multidrug transport system ATPase subunit